MHSYSIYLRKTKLIISPKSMTRSLDDVHSIRYVEVRELARIVLLAGVHSDRYVEVRELLRVVLM